MQKKRFRICVKFEMSAGMMFSCIIHLNYDMNVTVRICEFLSIFLFAQTDTHTHTHTHTHTRTVKTHTSLSNMLCVGHRVD